MIRNAAGALFATAMLVASPAHAAVTIGMQIVDTRLTGTIDGAPAESEGSDAGSRPGAVAAAAQLVAAGGGVAAVRGTSSVDAVLTSAERGRVTFRRTLTPGAVDGGAAILSSDAGYRYFFSTDTPTAFDVDWGVSASGSSAGGIMPAQGLSLGLRGTSDTLLRRDDLGDRSSGSARLFLDPGSYEFRIYDTFAPMRRLVRAADCRASTVSRCAPYPSRRRGCFSCSGSAALARCSVSGEGRPPRREYESSLTDLCG